MQWLQTYCMAMLLTSLDTSKAYAVVFDNLLTAQLSATEMSAGTFECKIWTLGMCRVVMANKLADAKS